METFVPERTSFINVFQYGEEQRVPSPQNAITAPPWHGYGITTKTVPLLKAPPPVVVPYSAPPAPIARPAWGSLPSPSPVKLYSIVSVQRPPRDAGGASEKIVPHPGRPPELHEALPPPAVVP